MKKRISIIELASVDIDTVNKEDLVDVSGFTFDNSVPQEQRAARILEMVNNPFCYRVNDTGVQLEFLDSAPAIEDLFINFLLRQKGGL